nr:immunoglobulin light chain junction region [Macaca mulatta]MOV67948.1 immunoglobulin light chain junction region [Macaca mulatta]
DYYCCSYRSENTWLF